MKRYQVHEADHTEKRLGYHWVIIDRICVRTTGAFVERADARAFADYRNELDADEARAEGRAEALAEGNQP